MNTSKGLGFAGVVVGIVAVGVLAILVPARLWTADSVAATAVLFLSFASPLFMGAAIAGRYETDSPAIGLIGPLGRLWLILLVVAIAAVRVSFLGWHRGAWAICLCWVGVLVIGFLLLRASTDVVSVASKQTKLATADARTAWIGVLNTLQLQADDDGARQSLRSLAEKVQFAANDPNGQDSSENQQIGSLIGQFQGALRNSEELAGRIRSVEVLLMQREQSIRAGRSRA
jgi:hypothetical protein